MKTLVLNVFFASVLNNNKADYPLLHTYCRFTRCLCLAPNPVSQDPLIPHKKVPYKDNVWLLYTVLLTDLLLSTRTMTFTAAFTFLLTLNFLLHLVTYHVFACLHYYVFFSSIYPTFPIFYLPVVSLPSPVSSSSFYLNTNHTHYLKSSKSTLVLHHLHHWLFFPCHVPVMCSFRQIAHKWFCAVVPKLLLVRRGRLIKFSLFHSAIFCLFHLFKLLAIASFCTFSALFEIISNFCMLSFQLLLKSALSFSPKSSYPAQFPEFSVLCFFPQIFVFVARGTLLFLCSQSSSILLTLSQFFPQLCILL